MCASHLERIMSNNQNNTSLESQLVVIMLNFDIWSAQTKLEAKDLKLGLGGEIPPQHLAKLGTKTICNPEELRVFSKLKMRARRLCENYGRPFMGGYANPLFRYKEVELGLTQIQNLFEEAKTRFLHRFSEATESWIQENPEYADVIRRGMLTEAEVAKRFSFTFEMFKIEPIRSGGLNTAISKLASGLVGDVIDDAAQFYAEKLSGRSSILSSTKPTIQGLLVKVSGLSFLDSRMKHLEKLLELALTAYRPSVTQVSGGEFLQVMACFMILSDPEKLNDYIAGKISVIDSVNFDENSLPDTSIESQVALSVNEVDEDDDIDRYFSQITEDSDANQLPGNLDDEQF